MKQTDYLPALARAASISFLKLSIGWAPTKSLPLMTKEGVPEIPAELPALTSAATASAYLLLSRAALRASAAVHF